MFGTLRHVLKPPRRLAIELADHGDTSALSQLHGEGFARGWSDGEFSVFLSQEPYKCLVARRSGRGLNPPIGFVLFKHVLDEAEIISIAVKKGARKEGVGYALMGEAIRRLQADRAESLFLDVDEDNKAALALYRRLGFHEVDRRQAYYRDNTPGKKAPSAALVMRLDLG